MPSRNPIEAGTTDHFPISPHISIDGSSNDHTDAAIITPAANPNNDFCSSSDICCFVKKTIAEPRTMPTIGMSRPVIIVIFYFFASSMLPWT